MSTLNKQDGKTAFWRALEILETRALTEQELEETYAHLANIQAYLPTLSDDECARAEEIIGERAPAFKIFLASRPPDESSDDSDIPKWLVRECKKREEKLNALWNSWRSGLILDELARVFATENMGSFDAARWLENARDFFASNNFKVLNEDMVTVDIIAGYGSAIDRLLLDTKDFLNTHVVIRGDLEEPLIQGPGIRERAMSFVAGFIQWRSGIDQEFSLTLAKAISFSLPAHKKILDSRLDVILDERGCILVSNWKKPF